MLTATQNRTSLADEFKTPLDASQVLNESCGSSQACRFQLVQSEFSNSCVLLSFNEEHLEIRLPEKDGDTQLIPASICCVSFPYAASYCALLGHLVTIRRFESGYVHCVISVPNHLTVTNLRRSFRVPVPENSGLKTTIHTPANQKFKVNTCGVTEGGLEIEIPLTEIHDLAVGMAIDVELSFRDQIIKRTAEIRRVDGKRYGLAFMSGAPESCSVQRSQMRSLVLSMQQLWLRTRLNG